jgi:hypothetical protein
MAGAEPKEPQPTESVASPPPIPSTSRVQGSQAGSPQEKTTTENLRVIGGLLALVAGLIALVIIVLVAIGQLDKEQAGAATTAGITAVATIVGAYFGVKVGSDGTQAAIKGQKEEATKAQAFALAADPSKLDVIQAVLSGEPAAVDAPEQGAAPGNK